MVAITDTGYAEGVIRMGKEFAQEIRSSATEDAETCAQIVLLVAKLIAKAGMKE